jgi:hypothetical protein
MTIDTNALYYAVTISIILTLCVLLYLLAINIASGRAAKSGLLFSNNFKTIRSCLWYLFLLHVTSAVTVVSVLLKNEKILSIESCDVVNNVMVVGWVLRRFFIGLLWESRHRAINAVLEIRNWLAIKVLTKLLVIAPLVLLPLTTKTSKTYLSEDTDWVCVADETKKYSYIELITILGTCLAFFVLFLIQILYAYNILRIFKADVSQLTSKPDLHMYKTSISVNRRAWWTTLRNLFVTVCCLFWLILYEMPFNRNESPSTPHHLHFTYESDLILVLDVLTTDIVLYFVFRNCSFFLCFPCRSNIRLLRDCFVEDVVALPLLEEEKVSSASEDIR